MNIMESLPLWLWKGLSLPIPPLYHLPGLQALCSNACLSLGVGTTSCIMQLLYPVLLGTREHFC